MKTKVNLGHAGRDELTDLYVGPEDIALLILERFQKLLPPEPPSLMVKKITVTLEEVKAQVMTRSRLEADGNNDPDEEVFEACVIATQRFPHLFQLAVCKKSRENHLRAEVGLQYTAVRLS